MQEQMRWSQQIQRLVSQGEFQQALNLVRARLQQEPESAFYWLMLGNIWLACEQWPAAQQAFEQALQYAPDEAGLWSNLGWARARQLDAEAAAAAYARALQLEANLPEAWSNLASLQLSQGQYPAARISLARCLALVPQYYPALLLQSRLALLQGDAPAAIQVLQRLCAAWPQQHEAWRDLSCLQLEAGQLDLAEQTLRQGLPQVAFKAELQMLLGRLAGWQGNLEAANACYAQALQTRSDPLWQFVAAIGHPEIWFAEAPEAQQKYLDHLAQILALQRQQPLAPFRYLQDGFWLNIDTLWHLAYFTRGNLLQYKQAYAACFARPETPPHFPVKPWNPQNLLHLGVVVTARHEGIFCQLALGLLQALTAHQIQVTFFCKPDPILSRYPAASVQLPAATLTGLAAQIQQAGVDILYHWEVGSDSRNAFLPLLNPAPVQLTSWGTPVSTGLPTLDYYLSSTLLEPPDAQNHYSEQLICLETLPGWLVKTAPPPAADEDLHLPVGRLYVCLQNPLKLSPGFAEALQAIVRQDPEAQILLLQSRSPWVTQRAQRLFATVSERIHWLPLMSRERYLQVLQQAQVVLDPFFYSGGQTTDDALSLGLPIVTLPGDSARSRLCAGRYLQMQLHDALARDPAHYVQLALAIARRDPAVCPLRQAIAAKQDQLFAQERTVAELAEVLCQLAREKQVR
ncbi:MAG: tetratricopeptide repeat protein [Candidatus Sericytochromatia bacterium]|nr:tetratricopeptide repeat protein [Candidatus Sericytochromatia bacterium]